MAQSTSTVAAADIETVMWAVSVDQSGHRRFSLTVGSFNPDLHDRTLHGPTPDQVRVEGLVADVALQSVFDVGGVSHGPAP